jgi:hypothetical protein
VPTIKELRERGDRGEVAELLSRNGDSVWRTARAIHCNSASLYQLVRDLNIPYETKHACNNLDFLWGRDQFMIYLRMCAEEGRIVGGYKGFHSAAREWFEESGFDLEES